MVNLVNFRLPVSNADSCSANPSPSPNLALVYLRTKFGPNGPKPLKIKNIKRN